jgi:hypothetical protein
MQAIPVTTVRRRFGQTARRDVWWATPLAVFVGLGVFVVYATWAAFQNAHYTYGPYLSPFYAPELFGSSPHSWFGPKPVWWPDPLPFSPALLILPFPGLFRLTRYRGEHSFPLILQNVHRFFMWVAVVFIAFLAWDVWKALWFADAAGQTTFGIGLGTIILATNVVLLASYTWGCHVLRHVVGGQLDEVSKIPVCDFAYACVSSLNGRHQLFAWLSLVSVMSADLYVRLCSMGVLTDVRIV